MTTLPRVFVASLLLTAACAGSEAPSEAVLPAAAAQPTEAERVATALAKAETEAAEEAKRWTDDLKKKATELRDRSVTTTAEALPAILASEHRTPGARDRDAARHPVETLTFCGVEPTMTVVEVGAGGGWYTEILAPLLASQGQLVVAGPDAAGPADKMPTVYGRRLDLFLAKSPELYGKVERVTIGDPKLLKLGKDGTADRVLAFREMHGWQNRGEMDAYLTAVHAVLKDQGGEFCVVQHRAVAGTKGEDTSKTGYLDEQWVIDRALANGFLLAEKSEINANPKDTKDYPDGVWTLPPNFRAGETDKAKYAEIGESDRMTLRFTKVRAKPAP